MPIARARLAPVLLVLTAGSLAACGSSGSSAPLTPSYPTSTVGLNGPTVGSSTSAYPGSTISKDKSFSVVLPVGWTTVTSSAPGVVTFVRAPTAAHGVRTNFSVLRQAAPGVALADVVEQSRASLQQSGYAVSSAAPTTVGGISGQGLTATKTVRGQQLSERQYFVQHGSAVYITTMTSAAADATAAAAAQTAIFGSWAWSRS